MNSAPHIGHVYTSLACDVIARFMRLEGREVFFLTGTDEHGQKVEQSIPRKGKAAIFGHDKAVSSFYEKTFLAMRQSDPFPSAPFPSLVRLLFPPALVCARLAETCLGAGTLTSRR